MVGLASLDGTGLIEAKFILLVGLIIVAACFDVRSRRIPNWLVLAGLISSLGLQIHFADGFAAWGFGLLVGFGLFFPLYFVRTMGAGDVKLMAMVGAFLGPLSALGVVLTTLVAGGILAIAAALWSGALRRTMANVRVMLTHTMLKALQGAGPQMEALPASAGNVPYAVAIAVGTLIHLLLERSGHALFA